LKIRIGELGGWFWRGTIVRVARGIEGMAKICIMMGMLRMPFAGALLMN
jgi:hypothetical protein